MTCVICGKAFEEHEETTVIVEGNGICDDCERIGGEDLIIPTYFGDTP
ncbi:MAG: hypothetical protein WA240_03015 [Nitrospirota bacterium]